MSNSNTLDSVKICHAKVIIHKNGKEKRYGRPRYVVFHPREARAIGVIVKRPDLFWMIKRKERFLALDCVSVMGGNLVVDSKEGKAWEDAALNRLGIDFDECLVWNGMPVCTESGIELGEISSVEMDPETFKIVKINISEGSVKKALLGSIDMTRSDLVGYRNGSIVVSDDCADCQLEGGVAQKAGEAWGKTSAKTSVMNEKATAKTVDAIDKGSYKAGQAIGSVKKKVTSKSTEEHVKDAKKAVTKQLSESKGMFKSFKEEYDKARKGD